MFRPFVLPALLVAQALSLACETTAERPSERAVSSARPRTMASSGGQAPAPRRITKSHASMSAEPEIPPVHVPNGLSPGESRPLLILLHGLGASGTAMAEQTEWARFASKERLCWTAPDGSYDSHGRRFWDANSSCCNFERRKVDHVGRIRGLIENATRNYPIDEKRVFVIGFSNGGFMAHRLACELSGMITGIVSISGAGPSSNQKCTPAAPVNVLEVRGDSDEIVSYKGGHLFGDRNYPIHIGADLTVREWAARNGCSLEAHRGPVLDLEARIPGEETQVTRFANCTSGNVELWTVLGGGHHIGMRAPAQAAIWKFLNQ